METDFSHEIKPPSPYPLALLLGAVLIIVALALYSIPNYEKLLERALTDDDVARGQKWLGKISAAQRQKRPDFYELVGLWLKCSPLDKSNVAGARAFALEARKHYDQGNQQALPVLAALLPKSNDLDFVATQAREILASLNEVEQAEFSARLQSHAMAANRADMAAVVQEQWLIMHPPTAKKISELLQLWSWGNRPDRALQALERFTPPDVWLPDWSEPLAWSRIEFLEWAGRSEEALAFIQRWRQAPHATSLDARLMDALATAGMQSGRHAELIPEFKAWVQAHPQDSHAWNKLMELSAAGQDLPTAIMAARHLIELNPSDDAMVLRLAQYYEWNQDPVQAFGLYLGLTARGNEHALQRLLDLNQGLYRDMDVLERLRSGVQRNPTPRFLHEFAQRLVLAGEYDQAIQAYDRYLRISSQDAKAWAQLGLLLRQTGDLQRAQTAFQQAATLQPNNLEFGRWVAENEYLRGEFSNSLQKYRSLAKDKHDTASILPYMGLAEAAGDIDGWIEARELLLKNSMEMKPEDFLRLAYGHSIREHSRRQIEVLQEGLRRYPANPSIRMELGYTFAKYQETGKALEILDAEKNNPPSEQSLALRLQLYESQQLTGKAMALLSRPEMASLLDYPDVALPAARIAFSAGRMKEAEWYVEKVLNNTPTDEDARSIYVLILAKTGREERARALLQEWSERNASPRLLRIMAQTYANLGSFQHAEKVQRKLVAQPGDASYLDWGFLGDVQRERGKRHESKETYRKAIQTIFEDKGAEKETDGN